MEKSLYSKAGLETDQDMGSYERFLGRDLGPKITTVAWCTSVIDRERALVYAGKWSLFLIFLKRSFHASLRRATKERYTLIEVGGTLEYQSVMFGEAARSSRWQIRMMYFRARVLSSGAGKLGEMKTANFGFARSTHTVYGRHHHRARRSSS